jgi:hypothetical protein
LYPPQKDNQVVTDGECDTLLGREEKFDRTSGDIFVEKSCSAVVHSDNAGRNNEENMMLLKQRK